MSKQLTQKKDILAATPYKTQFVTVSGSKMAYVEAGEGDPILFLHGNPTSKYLWRNIMPYLENQGRVIARISSAWANRTNLTSHIAIKTILTI